MKNYTLRRSRSRFNNSSSRFVCPATDVFSSGYDLNEFLLGLEDHFRNILVLKAAKSPEYLDISELVVKRSFIDN